MLFRSCPEVEFIQLARPTLSLSKYLQQVGRGMRVSEGKPHVLILDQVGLYQTFGLPTDVRDWRGMFLGRESGRGNREVSRCVLADTMPDGSARQRALVNLEMVCIKCGGSRRRGLEVFVENGRYGVMRNGRVTCRAVFSEVRRLERDSKFFALGVYPPVRNVQPVTVISRQGEDLQVRLYGRVTQEGDFFRSDSNTPFPLYWDSVSGRYSYGMPQVAVCGGMELISCDQGWTLRKGTGFVSPHFYEEELLYNRDIAIAKDCLIVKRDHNHAYRICGYLGASAIVQSEREYGFLQIFHDGRVGEHFAHAPKEMCRVPDFKLLGLRKVERPKVSV